MAPVGFEDKVAFVWKVADKLRGTFKQHEYGAVMLPLLVLRRMDAVLAPTKDAVRAKAVTFAEINEGTGAILKKVAGHRFYNTSAFTFSSMLSDDRNVAANIRDYITSCPRRRIASSRHTSSTARSSGWTALVSCMPSWPTLPTWTCAPAR